MSMDKDLSANYEIIKMMEKSQFVMKNIHNEYPGIYLLTDKTGRVLRCNKEAARFLKVPLEETINVNFSKLFSPEHWKVFAQNVYKNETNAMELAIDIDNHRYPFYWISTKISEERESKKLDLLTDEIEGDFEIYSIVGQDISVIRNMQKEMSYFYSSMPLGILLIGPGGEILNNFSKYTEYLLEDKLLKGKNIFDALFNRCQETIKKEEWISLQNILGLFGEVQLIFEAMEISFPKIMKINGSFGASMVLGVSYRPVVEMGKVVKILILIEDKTSSLEHFNRDDEKKNISEKYTEILSQVISCPKDVVDVLVNELKELGEKLQLAFDSRSTIKMSNILHGLKGNARTAEFMDLNSYSHYLESVLLQGEGSEETLDWDHVTEQVNLIAEECKMIDKIHRTFVLEEDFSQQIETAPTSTNHDFFPPVWWGKLQNDINILNQNLLYQPYDLPNLMALEEKTLYQNLNQGIDLQQLTPLLKKRIEKICEKTEKLVDTHIKFDHAYLCATRKLAISECLQHILTNAISHGIELPQQRLKKGKKEVGNIEIKIRGHWGFIEGEITDDGDGIKTEMIKKKLLEMGLYTQGNISSLSEHDIDNMIFSPRLSTAENVDNISGRGIGLSTVKSLIEENSGQIEVRSKRGEGTKFHFYFWGLDNFPLQMSSFKPQQVLELFHEKIKNFIHFNQWKELLVCQENKFAEEKDDGGQMILIDSRRLLLFSYYFLCGISKKLKAPAKVSLNIKKQRLVMDFILSPKDTMDTDFAFENFSIFVNLFMRKLLQGHGGEFISKEKKITLFLTAAI